MSRAQRRADTLMNDHFQVMFPPPIETRQQRRSRRFQAVKTGMEWYGIAAMIRWTWNALRAG